MTVLYVCTKHLLLFTFSIQKLGNRPKGQCYFHVYASTLNSCEEIEAKDLTLLAQTSATVLNTEEYFIENMYTFIMIHTISKSS